MSYTVEDLNLIQGVVLYIDNVRKSLRKESEMVKTLEMHPTGEQ